MCSRVHCVFSHHLTLLFKATSYWRPCTQTNTHVSVLAQTQTLHLPNILCLPLHVLHGGVCVGLWKQLGLIIDVLHFNQFHHSVRLIKVSAMLPGAVYVWGCEWIKRKVCVRWTVYVCFPAPGGSMLHFISQNTWEFSISGTRDERRSFSLSLACALSLAVSLPLFPSFCVSLSLAHSFPSLSPGRILNAINTAALLPANY